MEFDVWVPPGSRCLQIWDCVEDIESKVTTAFAGQQDAEGTDESEGDEAEDRDIESDAEEEPIQQARNPRGRLRGPASRGQQAAADIDMDSMASKEEDQDSNEDVEMGGMGDDEEMADNITVAPIPEEPPQLSHAGGQAAQRRSRRGSRVPKGIFAL